jgi:CHRD domain
MRSHRLIRRAVVAVAAIAAVLAVAAVAAGSTTLHVKLTGAAETPKADGGSGRAALTLNASNGRVCWIFSNLKGIKSATAAHIHKAPKGRAGAIVVPLGGTFKAKGCTKSTKATVKAILKKPGAYYVNIHTKKFPNGAIRGQL